MDVDNNIPGGGGDQGGGGAGLMEGAGRTLLDAASSGDTTLIAGMNSNLLLQKTPQGNTCLHISSMHGHEKFCSVVYNREESLLSAVNLELQTPLLIAVTMGHDKLASTLLERYIKRPRLWLVIRQQDTGGCNALHHAIRNGHETLAKELIAADRTLSQGVNKYNESPMFIALMKGFNDVFQTLLDIPDSAHGGPCGRNVLHAAVCYGDYGIAYNIMGERPMLATEADIQGNTPTMLAVYWNKTDVLRALLERNRSLGYVMGEGGSPLLSYAAYGGHVDVARELLTHCPDAPYRGVDGITCLHEAVQGSRSKFVEFIVRAPQLQNVLNMQDADGKTALHYAVKMCNPEMVRALLSRKDIDTTMMDKNYSSIVQQLGTYNVKTLSWNKVCLLMSEANPRDDTIYTLREAAKQEATYESRNDAKSLTQIYTSNTSLVAILMATITFAAAFTVPGGYSSSGPGSEGHPILSRKFAFQAFVISDTLAMCSSFAVAFICIIAKWGDYEFLIYYRSFTKKLMWFAYIATTTAFSTGLYTVLDPQLHWLAIGIIILVGLLPIVTKLLGEWPVLKLKVRSGDLFSRDEDFLSMV